MSDALLILLSFPFAQIGRGLRALSLMGGAGNVVAWAGYLALCFSPYAVIFVRRHKTKTEDLLLVLLNFLLLVTMYFMINPREWGRGPIPFPQEMLSALMGATLWSALLAYGLIRVARRFFTAESGALLRYLKYFLIAVSALLGFAVGIQIVSAIRHVGSAPIVYNLFAVVPYVLNIWVVHIAIKLVNTLQVDFFSEEALQTAQHLSRVCFVALAVTVLSAMAVNIGQMLFSARLAHIHIDVSFPVVSVLVMLGALLFARFIAQGKAVQEENEGFI
ncbi:MAG: hypothetical protein FWC16_11725 [Defluviitaleaceae bacterium]|nr:hypothetical protein [Defluviitaleaceae bacterium]MCL2275587.1 hypothetical protein [Defluviitaleaceae bacterium]